MEKRERERDRDRDRPKGNERQKEKRRYIPKLKKGREEIETQKEEK
jgi:hypothetical protein